MGPGGDEDLKAEDTRTTVELDQTETESNVELVDDGSAVR